MYMINLIVAGEAIVWSLKQWPTTIEVKISIDRAYDQVARYFNITNQLGQEDDCIKTRYIFKSLLGGSAICSVLAFFTWKDNKIREDIAAQIQAHLDVQDTLETSVGNKFLLPAAATLACFLCYRWEDYIEQQKIDQIIGDNPPPEDVD